MVLEVVLEYPRTLYKVPGSISGSGFLPGKTYDEVLAQTEDEAKARMKEGFFLTPNEAKEADDVAIEKARIEAIEKAEAEAEQARIAAEAEAKASAKAAPKAGN